MSSKTPIISLVVPTIHRVKEFERLLNSIREQDFFSAGLGDLELIVVDQNADDRLSPVLKQFSESLRPHIIRMAPSGTSNAKNAGIALSTGKFIGFPDDDCWYPPQALRQVVVELESRSQGGREVGIFATAFDPDRAEYLLSGFSQNSLEIDFHNPEKAFLGLQICQYYPRQVITRIGGFDPTLGVGSVWGSGEETDLAVRALRSGCNIHFLPYIRIFHPQVNSSNMTPRKLYQYAQGMGAVCKKNGLTLHLAIKIIKQVLGSIFFGLSLRPRQAYFCWLVIAGRIQGYLGYKSIK